jgi:hypothetical protein
MINKYLLFAICIWLYGSVSAQNQVPNYSFETDSLCPDNYNEVTYSKGWLKSFTDNVAPYHTEYLNACGAPLFSVPTNTWGYQVAATGSAYMAECTMAPPVQVDYRENIYTKLSAPLIIGHAYEVSFKISHTNNSKNSSNNFGAKFAVTPNFPVNNYAQVYTDSVVSDTTVWTTVHGSFVADSAYQYIGLGNFFDDAHTTSVVTCPSCSFNQWGYYLDDICVVPVVNLVPNYSFEVDSLCPDNYNEVTYCKGWLKSFTNNVAPYHTEYLNACGTSLFSVPTNTWGYQVASTGVAYMAQCSMAPAVRQDYRENIYTKLSSSLVVGQVYEASFKISHTDNSQHASNNIGLKFATVPDFTISNSAQVYTSNVITDNVLWTTVSGTFTADSAYSYIGVGNFFDDAHTISIQSCPSCSFSQWGYYIDDIIVVPTDVSCNSDITTSINVLKPLTGLNMEIYPVPATEILHIHLTLGSEQTVTLDLLDLEGKLIRKVLSGKTMAGGTDMDLDLVGVSKNIYILRLTTDHETLVKKVILTY